MAAPGIDVTALLAGLGLGEQNPAAALGDGQWRSGSGAVASINPTCAQPLAMIGRATLEDYEALLAHAVQTQRHWRSVPAPRRGELVRAIADALRARREALATLITLEVGKPIAEARGEVQEMLDIADVAVGLSRRLEGSVLASERPQHRLYEQWQPLGVVGVVTAFNFPAAVWAWNALIAAVCGDVVLWKPSPKALLTAQAIQRLVEQVAGEQGAAGVFSLLCSDEIWPAERLATDQRVPLLSFTGSSAVGRSLAPLVAARFGRCLLECSGNNALIVDASADLDLALPAILFGAIGTAGQRCTTTRRLFIHRTRHAETCERLVAAYAQIRSGDPLDPQVLLGPLIDDPACRAFEQAVFDSQRSGGRLLSGGQRQRGPGFFVSPTLCESRNHWPVVQRETFGPLLHVQAFERFDEALALQNAVPQGLSSALFTNDLRHAEAFVAASGSDCGIANINLGTSGAEVGAAFGGEKDTGGGREAGSDAWKAYMRRQAVTINHGHTLPLAQGIVFGASTPVGR